FRKMCPMLPRFPAGAAVPKPNGMTIAITRAVAHHEAADALEARVDALWLRLELLRQDRGEMTVQMRAHLRLVEQMREHQRRRFVQHRAIEAHRVLDDTEPEVVVADAAPAEATGIDRLSPVFRGDGAMYEIGERDRAGVGAVAGANAEVDAKPI